MCTNIERCEVIVRAFVELIRRLKGDASQHTFAANVGADQGTISRTLSGDTRPSTALILGVIRAYPAHREEIFAALAADAEGEPVQAVA